MPAEPDSRTDLYSLGIVFWTLLTGRLAFEGDNPLDVIQAVLARRLAPASAIRLDVPDAISSVIRRMTQKQIEDRYHSISGIKFDLTKIRQMLGDGDSDALAHFVIGSEDVSSFFMLPAKLFGREEAHATLVKVIGRVANWQRSPSDPPVSGFHGNGSTSASTMSDPRDSMDFVERLSESSSISANSPSFAPQVPGSDPQSLQSVENAPQSSLNNFDNNSSVTGLSSTSHRSGHRPDQSTRPSKGFPTNSRQQNTQGRQRSRRCEIVSVLGAAGLGKSSLLTNLQTDIRNYGYFATSKFEAARQAPFEPLLQAMSSLFRQIFSETNLDSDYHRLVSNGVRPIWPSVCSMLDLPERLLDTNTQSTKHATIPTYQSFNKSLQLEIAEVSSTRSTQSGGALASELLRGANPRSVKFITNYIEVLRILSSSKLICLCLDDLQFADDESLQLLSKIIERKLGIVILATCRDTEVPSSVQNILEHKGANVTTIKLLPLNESVVVEYVAATLSRSRGYVFPLAVVCLEKTSGNPFYLRQILELCYRKGAIFYSWKDSTWQYDLDQVFAEFASSDYGEQLNTDFITKRLQDLPPAARSILAWASLLGTTFSFSLLQRLLGGGFFTAGDEPKTDCPQLLELSRPQPVANLVEGLQTALQAYILMPGGNEDEYSFSHDRYVRAASSLFECQDVEKMHFIIALTMMKDSPMDGRSLYARAQHVSQAAKIIKARVQQRRPFRSLLSEGAAKAIESGARSTALQYYETCLLLLQSDPWKEYAQDVDFDETLSLYTNAAELYWYQGQHTESQNLLNAIFANARTAAQKASAWIIQSKLLSGRGNIKGAFAALKTSLLELGLDIAAEPTWELCDEEYYKVKERYQQLNSKDIKERPLCSDPIVSSIGAVVIEAISAAFWSDSLLFYQMCIQAAKAHLTYPETFPQAGLTLSYFVATCIGRHADIPFAIQIDEASTQLLDLYGCSYTIGRALAVSALFVAHLRSPIRENAELYYRAIDNGLASGDKHQMLLSVGCIAAIKLFSGDELSEIESYCSSTLDDARDWERDLRGGTMIIGCR
ncbi:MAG: hypothetical protein Q9217_004849 [Psora testacea]